MVSRVFPGSISEDAGVKKGDIIIAINGNKFYNIDTARRYFKENNNLNEYILDILRNGEKQRRRIRINQNERVILGMFLSRERNGVVVKEILENSPAMFYEFNTGDLILNINETKINFPKDVSDIINKIGYGKEIKISLQRRKRLINKSVILYRWKQPIQERKSEYEDFIKDVKQIINILENNINRN